ncbi:MAG: protein-disulfide reductase DsbD family protein [Anaerolineales bacterium]
MSLKYRFQFSFLLLVLIILVTSCSGKKADLIPIGTFAKNSVTVSIYLGKTQNGNDALVASFAPPKGFHLYSKDIPRGGVDGLGRPTLLELTSDSQIKSAGEIIESAPAQIPDFEPKDLLVYPAGVVTLTLPVTLPTDKKWSEDEVSITYMACSDSGCKAPVVNEVISVHIPSTNSSQ